MNSQNKIICEDNESDKYVNLISQSLPHFPSLSSPDVQLYGCLCCCCCSEVSFETEREREGGREGERLKNLLRKKGRERGRKQFADVEVMMWFRENKCQICS